MTRALVEGNIEVVGMLRIQVWFIIRLVCLGCGGSGESLSEYTFKTCV